MAVTALGGMVVSGSLQVGGFDFVEAIVRSLQQHQGLLIGQEQAEAVKIEIGSARADALAEAEVAEAAGRDVTTGLLRRTVVDAGQVREAMLRSLAQIVEAVKDLLERTPAELSADIATRGMVLVGGGSLLRGFDELLRHETGLPVNRDPDPLTTVARGAGAALESVEILGRSRSGRRR